MKQPIPPHLLPDGFRGARDESILQSFRDTDEPFPPSMVHVQATERTKDLLHRAGFLRTRSCQYYAVKVHLDRLGRLQLTPPNKNTNA